MLRARTILCWLMCIGLAVGLCSCGKGCGCGKPEESSTDNGQQPPKESPAAKLDREKRALLNNTEWDINLVYKVGKAKKKESSKLKFVNNKVHIEKFSAEGYRASHYSLSIEPGGLVVWETMQTSKDGGTLSMRGDWHGEKMSGLVTNRPKDGEGRRFGFVSTASRKL